MLLQVPGNLSVKIIGHIAASRAPFERFSPLYYKYLHLHIRQRCMHATIQRERKEFSQRDFLIFSLKYFIAVFPCFICSPTTFSLNYDTRN
jgi:hypothetical protein